MYLARVHRSSRSSKRSSPWIDQTFHVHRIKRYWDERTASASVRCRSCRNRAWYKTSLELGRDAVSQPECDPTVMRAQSPASWYSFDFTGAVRAWAEGAPNYGVMIKVEKEVDTIDWRFWDRHNSNRNLRPYAMVQCLP